MFLDLIDEALLKTLFLFLRFLQIVDSLFIIGAVAQFASDVANAGGTPSDTYVAVLAIAGTAAVWSMFTSLITCCGGILFFNVDIVVDFLIGICFVVSSILLSHDARLNSGNFGGKYFAGSADTSGYSRDSNLVKAVYAFSILNIFLFLATVLESVVLLAIRRQRKYQHKEEHANASEHNQNHHHHHHHHHTHADGCSC